MIADADADDDHDDYDPNGNDEEESENNESLDWNSPCTEEDTNQIKVLKRFCKHLQHPDGGRKTPRDSFQCTQRIFKLSRFFSNDKRTNFNWITKHTQLWDDFVENQ